MATIRAYFGSWLCRDRVDKNTGVWERLVVGEKNRWARWVSLSAGKDRIGLGWGAPDSGPGRRDGRPLARAANGQVAPGTAHGAPGMGPGSAGPAPGSAWLAGALAYPWMPTLNHLIH